ncbi:MAG: hypothetical protein C3F13_14355 [Anaerolineales bacterium]|nr:hypothetical protein [Anaerolineae bacterium]PWB51612.1 MAG: hypothetical protein C3F13_14355 [Anaerolineales bacterium]
MTDKEETSQPSQLFTLRMWLEDLGEGQMDWRGKVQHIGSGEVRYFRSWQMLRDFVEDKLFSPGHEPGNTR